ncbi:MAG TPA: hypothetical protein VN132_11770, partial [Bdellovibrio sp.]|nr:hypothetical protein [Bdellovibrio sp.]
MMMRFLGAFCVFCSLLLVGTSQSFAMNLQDYLKTVQSKHKSIQAFDVQKEAADLRNVGSDIDLVPVMNAGISYLDDQSPFSQFVTLGAKRTKITDYNLGFSKKFSTGTTLGLSADA